MATTSSESLFSSNGDDSRTPTTVTDASASTEAPPGNVDVFLILDRPIPSSAGEGEPSAAGPPLVHFVHHYQDHAVAVSAGVVAAHSYGQANIVYSGSVTLSVSVQDELLYGIGAWAEA